MWGEWVGEWVGERDNGVLQVLERGGRKSLGMGMI